MCVLFWASNIDKDNQMSSSLKKKNSVLIEGLCIEWLISVHRKKHTKCLEVEFS